MLTPKYVITGLPRSRTAWMAAWLSTGEALCLHDVTRVCPHGAEDWEGEIAGRLREHSHRCPSAGFGLSDAGFTLFAEDLLLRFGEARLVVVRRGRKSSEESCLRFLREHPYRGASGIVADAGVARAVFDYAERGIRWLSKYWPSEHLLRVEFDELDEESRAREIWHFCNGPAVFETDRWRMFNDLRIETAAEKLTLAQGG